MPIQRIPVIPFAILILTACSGPARPAASPRPEQPQTLEQAETAPEEESYEASLRRLATSDDAQTRQRALARLALFFRSQSRLDEAAAALAEAAEANPLIRPHLRLELAEVELERGKAAEAAAVLRSVIEADARAPVADLARLRLPAALAAAGDPGEARAALGALKAIPLDALTDEEYEALASALEKGGLAAEAAQLRFRILQEYPRSRWTEKHYGSLTALPAEASPLTPLGFDALVSLADRLGRVNRYDQALDLIERIEKRFPDRRSDAQLRYVRTSALFNSRNYQRVTAESSRPGEPYHLAIQSLRGRAFWRNDQPKEFLATMDRVIAAAPKSKEAAAAKIALAKYYITDEPDHARAAKLLEEGIALGGAGSEGEHLWTLAWIHILAGNDDAALRVFDRYLASYPNADYTTNALFWSGKLWGKKGDAAKRDATLRRLIERYPYAYYSYRAREIVGDTSLPASEIASGVRFPELPAGPDPRLAVATELREVGLDRPAALELRRIAAAEPDNRILAWRLAEVYVEAGEPIRAIGLINRHFRDIVRHGGENLPPNFWQVLYPRRHWDVIRDASAAARVDPWLTLAIIRQESAWEPTTVSSAGAVGLMQIMPKEASSIAERAGLGPVTRQQLFDPETNIRVGTAELRQKLDAMEGNRTLAIASYNGGETAVRRWLSRQPIDDLDMFVDSISYAETRLYVMTVTRNLHEYRRVYGTE